MSDHHAEGDHGHDVHDKRHYLKHAVEHYCHMLSEQGPLNITFVHNNTLFGLQGQDLHFEEAIKESQRVRGAKGFYDNDVYRDWFRSGRINDDDLAVAMRRRNDIKDKLDEVVVTVGGRAVKLEEVYAANIVYGAEPLAAGMLRHEVFQNDALSTFRADVPETVRKVLIEKSGKDLATGLSNIGRNWTFADWVKAHTNLNLPEHIQAHTVAQVAGEHPPGNVASADSSMRAMGIPQDRYAGYLECVDKQFAHLSPVPTVEQRDQLRALWLNSEAALVDTISRRHFGVRGAVDSIKTHFNKNLEAYSVLSLWSATLGVYGLSDPLCPTDPVHFMARDADNGVTEALSEQFRLMQSWGGPRVPLNAELRGEIDTLIRSHLDTLKAGSAELEARVAAGEGATTLFSLKVGGEKDGVAAIETAHLCWIILHDIGFNHLNRRGLSALETLISVMGKTEEYAPLMEKLYLADPREKMLAHCRNDLADQIESFGKGRNHADFLKTVTGEDVVERVNRYMIKISAAFTDEGLAAWHMPGRVLGFYDAWRNLALHERSFDFDDLTGWRDALHNMPTLAEDAVLYCLEQLGIKQEQWGEYCARSLFRLKNWAAMMFWHELHPTRNKQVMHPTNALQYLAVRLFYELLLVRKTCKTVWQIDASAESINHYFTSHPSEYFVRRELYAGNLSDNLAQEARALVSNKPYSGGDEDDHWKILADMIWAWRESDGSDLRSGHNIYKSAWPVFHLAQLLGISGAELRDSGLDGAEKLLSTLNSLPPTSHGIIWLLAMERHYHDEITNAFKQNHGKGRWRTRHKRPKAQVIFCIDEREESIHRAFDELDPEYETFGAAGFTGVVHDYQGLDWHDSKPLCPQVRVPAHRTFEVPRDAAFSTTAPLHKKRFRWLEAAHNAYWEAKRNVLSSYFIIDLFGFLMALPLVGRVFFPVKYFAGMEKLHQVVVPPVETEVFFKRPTESDIQKYGFNPIGKPIGYTEEEQVNMMEALLRNIGMTHNFAPIIINCMHGSTMENNPHKNAYDCGAVSGDHSGPNARTMAAMCNRPLVREGLRKRGIDILDDTWFVGGEHNTTSDLITLYDTQDVPAHLREKFEIVASDLVYAGKKAARERCRRFASAPKDASPEVSYHHVVGRSVDFSQTRPEYGHCTNAFAVVGRRSVLQGVFFDRRGFGISYDPTIDPDGKILERTLLAVGPVGAGINLEFYFSTVDHIGYGCDTKVPHNVTGMIGVMNGAHGDLETGLPRQVTYLHEPMRLQLFVEVNPGIAVEIYKRQPAIQQLLNKEWVLLTVIDPDTGDFIQFFPNGVGFAKWEKPLTPLPVVNESFEWYKGKYQKFLPPCFIKEPTARWDQRGRA